MAYAPQLNSPQQRIFAQQIEARNDAKPCSKFNFLTKVGNIFIAYLKNGEGIKNLCKITYQSIDWWKLKSSDVPKNILALRDVTSVGKNVISTAEIPEKTLKLGGRVRDLAHVKSFAQVPGAAKNVVTAGSTLTGPVSDAFKLAVSKNIIKASAETIKRVDVISFGGLALGTTISCLEEANKIAHMNAEFARAASPEETKEKAHKVVHSLINLGKFVSYSTLGTFGLLPIVAGITLAPWMFPAAATSALLFNIGGHFYGKINNIESK